MRYFLKSRTALSRSSVRFLPRSQKRRVQISSISSIPSNSADSLSLENPASSVVSPDATFDILASPDPLLSVSLSPSQNLYTRRGTLVGVSGKAENAISTLTTLEPFTRALLRIPFIYQRISATSAINALISTKSTSTSLAVVHLDGSLDWILAGKALLAWTGQTLTVRPTVNRRMSLAHWGSSEVTGRGLLALTGRGSICQLVLKPGESYIAHPSYIVAYSLNATPPSPYRFKSSVLRFQVPRLKVTGLLPDTRFFRVMRESPTWRNLRRAFFGMRTWLRKTVWGDRLFLEFHGPTTVLLQTRAARLNEVFSNRDVDEVANTAPGQSTLTLLPKGLSKNDPPSEKDEKRSGSRLSTANVRSDGKVVFETVKYPDGAPR
ncbi:altered inheritance of mitochondria protein 24 [Physcia stellaris]|nr:altered inheritance of mitochondria protein 24 [Physcia stellaris]